MVFEKLKDLIVVFVEISVGINYIVLDDVKIDLFG